MVVDHCNRRGKPLLQPFSRPEVVGAIDENRHPVFMLPQHIVRAQKIHSRHEELQPARHRIRVHAHHVETLPGEHAGQRHLRPDAVAVRPGMTDHRDLPSGEIRQQTRESLRQGGIKFFHGDR